MLVDGTEEAGATGTMLSNQKKGGRRKRT